MTGKKAFIIIANCFIAAVLVQTYVRPFPDMILSGAEKKAVLSMPSFEDISTQKFQMLVEKYLKQNIGFRGTFVKTDNQINYSLFNEFSRSHPRKIILGKDKQLYEEPYIDVYNRISVPGEAEMERKARSLKLLQERLAARNIRFLLLVTPCKTTLMPEYIPEKLIHRENLSRRDNYQVLVPLLKKHGVNYLDGREMFLDMKKRGVPGLFPSSGTHWSLYGGCLFSERLIERMEKLLGKRLVRITSDRLVTSREPIELDKDIARLGNILFTRSLFTRYLYPVTHRDAPAGAARPDILLVGSSYCWNFIEYMDINKTFSTLDFLYYFNTRYSYPGKKRGSIDRQGLDWEKTLRGRDIVLIEVNEVAIPEIGYDFIETALSAMEK